MCVNCANEIFVDENKDLNNRSMGNHANFMNGVTDLYKFISPRFRCGTSLLKTLPFDKLVEDKDEKSCQIPADTLLRYGNLFVFWGIASVIAQYNVHILLIFWCIQKVGWYFGSKFACWKKSRHPRIKHFLSSPFSWASRNRFCVKMVMICKLQRIRRTRLLVS